MLLRRLGDKPITKDRASQIAEEVAAHHLEEPPPNETQPHAEEKRAMRRAFWLYSLGVRYSSPASIVALSITLILGGAAYIGLMCWFFAVANSHLHSRSDAVGVEIFTGFFSALGLVMIILGSRLIPTWQRINHSPITTIEGKILRWKAFGSSSRPHTIIVFAAADGTNHIFGVAPRFRFRAQSTGTQLAITYRTANDHVIDIQEIE